MKINASDFKNLQNGREIRKTLTLMSKVTGDENPYPLFNQLMDLVRATNIYETIPAIYPYLVGMAMESTDISYVNFVVTMKLGFYQKVDLEELTNMQLRHYVASMYNLRKHLPTKPTKNVEEWRDIFKDMYLWNTFLIYCSAPDVFAFCKNARFEKPFKVKCLHCGNDIHSLYIDVESPEKTTAITPGSLDGRIWDELDFDDVFLSFSSLCANFKEEYFTRILPYVYGSYHCSRCKKENQVMEAVLAYQFQEEPWYVPSDKFLARLRKMAFSFENDLSLEKWVFSTYVLSQYRLRFGVNSTLAMEFILEIAEDLGKELPDDIFQDLIKQAEKVSFSGDFAAVLCRVKAGFFRRSAPEKVADCYQTGLAMVADTWAGWQLRRDFALFLAETQPEEGEKALLTLYEEVKTQGNQEFLWQLDEELVKVYLKQKKFPQAISYQKSKSQRSKELYGENSEVYAQQSHIYGLLCLEEGDFQGAQGIFQEIYQMELNNLAQYAFLPPPFSSGQKILPMKKMDHANIMFNRGRLAGISALNLGHIAMEQGDFPLALDYYKEQLALFRWIIALDLLEEGNLYHDMAMAYHAMGQGKKTKDFLKKSRKIYQKCLKDRYYRHQESHCQERLAKIQQYLQQKP